MIPRITLGKVTTMASGMSLRDLEGQVARFRLAHAEDAARRGAAIVRKNTAEKVFADAEPKARLVHQRAAAERAAAFAVHARLNTAAMEAYFALMGVADRHQREVAMADADLIDTAPPCYEATLEWLDAESSKCRHSRYGKSGAARMQALLAARKQVEALRLDLREDEKAEAHIEKLRKSLPPLAD